VVEAVLRLPLLNALLTHCQQQQRHNSRYIHMWQLNTAIDVIPNHCFASMIWPMSFVLLSLVCWCDQARSVPGIGISISRLSSDYLDTTGVCSSLPSQPASHSVRQATAAAAATAGEGEGSQASSGPGAAANAKPGTAAPALFQFRGRWYLLLAQQRPRKSKWYACVVLSSAC